MRLTGLGVMVALGALACGGAKKTDQAQAAQPAAGQTTATATAVPTGPGGEVKMTGNGTNVAAFVPKTLQIPAGTTGRILNRPRRPPHNSVFPHPPPSRAAPVIDTWTR